MDLGIAGRSALVCAASRGLGYACALALAQEGVHVTIVARGRSGLDAAADAIDAAIGRRPQAVQADVTTEAGRAAALAACPAPDILVTNAGGPPPGDFRDWTRDDWMAALDALMLAPIALMRATVDGMAARRFGRVVNIASRTVKHAQPELGLSNGARAGLVGFVAGLSRELVRHNVTINTLLPGPFATDGQAEHIARLAQASGRDAAAIQAERQARNPAGRFGLPEELGAWCAFLCSAQAGFATGQNVVVDGGQYPGTF